MSTEAPHGVIQFDHSLTGSYRYDQAELDKEVGKNDFLFNYIPLCWNHKFQNLF